MDIFIFRFIPRTLSENIEKNRFTIRKIQNEYKLLLIRFLEIFTVFPILFQISYDFSQHIHLLAIF